MRNRDAHPGVHVLTNRAVEARRCRAPHRYGAPRYVRPCGPMRCEPILWSRPPDGDVDGPGREIEKAFEPPPGRRRGAGRSPPRRRSVAGRATRSPARRSELRGMPCVAGTILLLPLGSALEQLIIELEQLSTTASSPGASMRRELSRGESGPSLLPAPSSRSLVLEPRGALDGLRPERVVALRAGPPSATLRRGPPERASGAPRDLAVAGQQTPARVADASRGCPTHFLGKPLAQERRTHTVHVDPVRRHSPTPIRHRDVQEARRSLGVKAPPRLRSEDRRTARAPRSRRTFATCLFSGRRAHLSRCSWPRCHLLDRRARRQASTSSQRPCGAGGAGCEAEIATSMCRARHARGMIESGEAVLPLLWPLARQLRPHTRRLISRSSQRPSLLRERSAVRFVDPLARRRSAQGVPRRVATREPRPATAHPTRG